MSIAGHLVAYAARQLFDHDIESAVEQFELLAPGAWSTVKKVKNYTTDHAGNLPDALRKANDRAWKSLELALGGGGRFEKLVSQLYGDRRGAIHRIREFLDTAPGLPAVTAEERTQALAELHGLQHAQRLTADLAAATPYFRQYAHCPDAAEPTDAAFVAVARTADALAAEAPTLAAILRRRPPAGRSPLLAEAFGFFLDRAIAGDAELSRTLVFRQLQALSAANREQYAALAEQWDDLIRELNELHHKLDANREQDSAFQQSVLKSLAELKKADHARPIEFTERTRTTHSKLRQQLAAMNASPTPFAAADWQTLGDLFSAARLYPEATACHERAALQARANHDTKAEALAHHRTYRNACQQRDHATALTALFKAVELDRQYEPFPFRKFQPVAILGAGGFSVVFHCHDRFMKEDKAIKALHETDDVFGEAHLLKSLKHPNIIPVHDADAMPSGAAYLVMELFAHPTLEEVCQNAGGALTYERLRPILTGTAAGLKASHDQGIIHRDVKPANVLVGEVEGRAHPKLTDFGLAIDASGLTPTRKRRSTSQQGQGGGFDGTELYASPEQKGETDHPVTAKSDVYSFGRMAIAALYKHPGSLGKLQRDASVPEPVRRVLERAVEVEPGDRPTLDEVTAALAGEVVATPAPSAEPTVEPQVAPAPAPKPLQAGDITVVRVPSKPADAGMTTLRVVGRRAELTTLRVKLPERPKGWLNNLFGG